MALAGTQRTNEAFQTMIEVVLNQDFFGWLHGFLHGLQLPRNFQAVSPCFQHVDGAVEMSVGPAQAFDDRLVGTPVHVFVS